MIDRFVFLIILSLMSIMDNLCTIRTLGYLRNKGDINWLEAEANVIPKFFYGFLGFKLGFIVQQLFAIIMLILVYLILPIEIMYIVFGAFIIVIFIHYQNMMTIYYKKKQKIKGDDDETKK